MSNTSKVVNIKVAADRKRVRPKLRKRLLRIRLYSGKSQVGKLIADESCYAD